MIIMTPTISKDSVIKILFVLMKTESWRFQIPLV